MVTTQDCSIGLVLESVYKTPVTVTRWYEYVDESLDWNKNVKQGQGLRVGSRVARSARRVIPSADGGGDFTVEAISKGMGLLWQLCLGAGVSTLVSGSTQQQLFTLGDTPPSATIQKGVVEAGGTVDAITFAGCMVDSWEFAVPNADIATLKPTWDIGDVSTATGYAAPSYPAAPLNLFHFAGASIQSGALTAPTTTALGVGGTTIADVRDVSIACANNLKNDRFNATGTGRKSKPTVGLRELTGKLTAEYDVTTWRDAVLNETPMNLVVNLVTAGALSTGVETLQVIVPEIKFNSELPKTNGPDLITQSMDFNGLDNLTAAQPIWVVMRTADAAL